MTGRVVSLQELEELFREAGGVRVTHGDDHTWARMRGRPELAFGDPGIRDTDRFVRLVGPLLPGAKMQEDVLVERVNEAGVVEKAEIWEVRDRLDDPGTEFSDLHLGNRRDA